MECKTLEDRSTPKGPDLDLGTPPSDPTVVSTWDSVHACWEYRTDSLWHMPEEHMSWATRAARGTARAAGRSAVVRARMEERSVAVALRSSTAEDPAVFDFGAARHISCTMPLISLRLESQAEEVSSRVTIVLGSDQNVMIDKRGMDRTSETEAMAAGPPL